MDILNKTKDLEVQCRLYIFEQLYNDQISLLKEKTKEYLKALDQVAYEKKTEINSKRAQKMLLMKPEELKKLIINQNLKSDEQKEMSYKNDNHLPFEGLILRFAEEVDNGLYIPSLSYSWSKVQFEEATDQYFNTFRQRYSIFRFRLVQQSKHKSKRSVG